MTERHITVRMDVSSWDQIADDLGNYWGVNFEDSEVGQSVEVLGYSEGAAPSECRCVLPTNPVIDGYRCGCNRLWGRSGPDNTWRELHNPEVAEIATGVPQERQARG